MKVLLYVSGSISCYKAFDITRELSKKGHEIIVLLSKGAQKFLKKELFTFLGASSCYGNEEDFTVNSILHIELARWCDLMAVVPASANKISTLANGMASDLGSSTFLAMGDEKPTLIFPAMNTKMLNHPSVKRNFSLINNFNNCTIFETKNGTLACNEIGEGKLLDTENIVTLIESFPKNSPTTCKKNILLSTGASLNPLDDVRFISNPATGKTGEEIAKVLLHEGHHLTVIFGGTNKNLFKNFYGHPNLILIPATTTKDFYTKTITEIDIADVFISSAALSDIEFSYQTGKIKKNQMGSALPYKKSIDILFEVLKNKNEKLKVIGFAAESDLRDEIIEEKLRRKPVDFLVATLVDSGITKNKNPSGFSSDEASYKLIDQNKKTFEGFLSKSALAKTINERIITW